MIRLAFTIFCLSLPASAQTVRVTSGEHDGFTRLVFQMPADQGWRLARQEGGYQLRLEKDRRFDLTNVYRPIGRNRLATIWADPETGALRLGVGCACHAIPFVDRPGILVIDIKDGPPPSGSKFEQDAEGQPLPAIAARPKLRPRPRPHQGAGYDWLELALDHSRGKTDMFITSGPATVPSPAHDTGFLRETLLRQISQGAAVGVIDMALPPRNVHMAAPQTGDPPAQIRIRTPFPSSFDGHADAVNDKGAACPMPAQLAVNDWIGTAPLAEQIGPAMAGLTGELDRPEPDAVARAARFLVAAGFGAEARALMDALPTGLDDERLWRSLSHIIEDEADADPAFAGMAACENAASLWAMLTRPAPAQGTAIATGDVLQAFSALPGHLRLHLGGRLAEALIKAGKPDVAETIQAAMDRASRGAEATLVQAHTAIANGRPNDAETAVATLASAPGPARAEGLATLIEARVAQKLPVGADQVAAIEALLWERGDDASAYRLVRALILGRAGAGDFAGAFKDLPRAPDMAPQIWDMLANSGTDNDLVIHALSDGPSPAAGPSADRIARRLAALGLGKAATAWVDESANPALAAQAALAEGDGRSALRLLAGEVGAEADKLRSEALVRTGNDAAAADVYARTGQPLAHDLAQVRARNWAAVATSAPDPWREAAVLATSAAPSTTEGAEPGPLSHARALVDDSARARSVLTALLSETAIAD